MRSLPETRRAWSELFARCGRVVWSSFVQPVGVWRIVHISFFVVVGEPAGGLGMYVGVVRAAERDTMRQPRYGSMPIDGTARRPTKKFGVINPELLSECAGGRAPVALSESPDLL